MISAYCTKCGHQYRVKDEHAGRSVKCRQCQGVVRIPAAADDDVNLGEIDLHAFADADVDDDVEYAGASPRRGRTRKKGSSSGPAFPPLSVIAVGLLVLFNSGIRILDVVAASGSGPLLVWQLTLSLLVLTGLALRVRLLWQFTRLISAMAIVLSLFGIVVRLVGGTLGLGGLIGTLVLVGLHLGIIAALERPSARDWFGLTCPKCGSHRGNSADFLFRSVRCKDCNKKW